MRKLITARARENKRSARMLAKTIRYPYVWSYHRVISLADIRADRTYQLQKFHNLVGIEYSCHKNVDGSGDSGPFHSPGGGGGGGYLAKFNTGGSAPRSNPLSFYIPFWQKRYLFYIPFIKKRYPFSHAYFTTLHLFLRPSNKVIKWTILRENISHYQGKCHKCVCSKYFN